MNHLPRWSQLEPSGEAVTSRSSSPADAHSALPVSVATASLSGGALANPAEGEASRVDLRATRFVPHVPGQTAPAADVAELQFRARALLPVIKAGAARREADRVLPYGLMREIARQGLYTLRVPKAFGGPGGRLRDVFRLLIDIASVDSNIAQAMRPGLGFVETMLLANEPGEQQRWFPLVLDGQIFGNAGWERSGPSGQVSGRIERDGDGYVVTGQKFYSTGALYADWIASLAIDEEGRERSFIIARDRPGVQLLDDFDAMGQRLTASGTTVFERAPLLAHEVRRGPSRDRRSPLPPFYQLVLAAVLAGIARNALEDAVSFARDHARPIKHSSATRSVDDPYVQQAVGQIAAQAYAADAVVIRAAEAIDAAWDAGLTQAALTTASLDVAQAQFFATQAALDASELLFEVGGASTTGRSFNHDRHWRNARTVANHNPRQWKAAAVGNYLLTGTAPPTTGLF